MVFMSRIRIATARLFVVLALTWERAVPVLFPALLFPALYIALAFFGVWERFGDPWRLLVLIPSAGLTVYYGYLGLRGFHWPASNERSRRLEADVNLRGRPLEVLSDQPVQGANKEGRRLWQEQQTRARQTLTRLRPRKPRAMLARRDVYGLRAGAMLLVFAGAIMAGPRAIGRLEEAFAPRILSHAITTARIEAWITGPDYALLAPKFLRKNDNEAVEVLAGSRFHLKVSGVGKRPVLQMRNGGKKRRLRMQKTGPQNFDLDVLLDKNITLALNRPLSKFWQINTRADLPPKVLFTTMPKGDTADALIFSYIVSDDVGIDTIELELALADSSAEPQRTALDLPAKNARSLDEKAMLDFTRHRWAGLSVIARLIARDGTGQQATTKTVSLILPDKLFVNPMAKAIAEQRTLLIRVDEPYKPMPKRPVQTEQSVREQPPFAIDNPAERLERAPAPIQRSAALMRASLRAPEMFFEDPLVYVGLRYAAENLRLARRSADYVGLDDELWALALWAEGGALADARAAMKAAERAFRRALARGAPADELARLMYNYERAVKRYLEALAEEALRRGQKIDGGNGAGGSMDANALQEMLDALKALSETGARGDARKLLQALSDLLENMKMQLTAGSGPGNDAASEAMRKALEALGDITAEQRELLDEMFREQQGAKGSGSPEGGSEEQGAQSPGGQPGGQPGTGLAGEQEGLGTRLRALADGQREEGREGAGGALGEGADDMDQAANALREDDINGALEAGKDALSALRDGSEALASDLFRHIQEQNGQGAGEDRDPFGRPTRGGGSQSADGTDVPDVINAERAREILQLLRDRAAEQGRSAKELEYLDRLLERF